MSHNSNFISNFDDNLSSSIDILTSVSTSVGPLETNLNGGGNYYGRYFCVGNLLIQFSDFSDGISPGSSTENNNYYMKFPYPYDSTPYFVGVFPVKQENQNFPTCITLTSFTDTEFVFDISLNNGEISF